MLPRPKTYRLNILSILTKRLELIRALDGLAWVLASVASERLGKLKFFEPGWAYIE